ncbi:NUDIX domain-containing protein [Caldisalinibacter kiritimatiensis]|uniref:Dihydroneopterin triphosphate pyrophosphohydolase n=1 Tax=Caldisalinibacter kiritimatiensis TaxID=1304284 RepID=R1CN40_9FIRM|nr:NUDIX domain-containing protein [Caldisalinibacter kiritimatiensis]EOD00126.1 Dihydroneopterin triphosphate pyrophosphohydolase [Caldisalinibacter kiritimatiensis]
MRYPEPTVGAIIFNPDKKILLCKSSKWDNNYVIPGGHIELGETMEEALRREVLEETGLKIYDINPIGITESIFSDAYHQQKHFIFIAYICKTDSYDVTLNEEAEEYKWVDLKEIEDLELDGFTESLLNKIRNKEGRNNKVEIFYKY